jgi:lipoteichoic acid synthase
MMALSVFVVLVVAKLLAVAGRPVPVTGWATMALVWQDALVALVFFALSRGLRRPALERAVYVVVVTFALVNLPVERALGSPLTMQMLRATSGTIGDSFRYYATPGNVLALASVVITAVGAPVAFARVSRTVAPRSGLLTISGAILIVVLGRIGAGRVDMSGFDRTPLVALVRSTQVRVAAAEAAHSAVSADWRRSPFGETTGEDLRSLRGIASGRNVLLIVLESTAARYLRSYGAPDDPTPQLTALASDALVFDNAYSVYPESVRGLVALLGGHFPALDVATEAHAAQMTQSLAATLARHGYNTALFHSGRFMYLGMDALLARAGFDTLADAGAVGGEVNSSFGVDEPSTVRALLRWIDAQHPETPFFAAYLPIAGHHPYAHALAGPWREANAFDRYRNALYDGDAAIGQLLTGLRARGLDRSTLIVVVADHGEAFGQHPGNFVHTLAIYDENVRVPMFIAAPGLSLSRRVSRVASLIDVTPTIADLVGVERPTGQTESGESLLEPRSRMALFFTDYSLGLLGLRDGCTSVIYEIETRRSRMYDLCVDPRQEHDIAAAHAARAAVYREHLLRWSAAQVARVTAGR